MTEQRYKAVLAVISDGRTVTEVARDWNVSRQTMHEWLERYEDEGLEGLANRSHRPAHSPHQMSAEVEAQLLELRRARPYLGASTAQDLRWCCYSVSLVPPLPSRLGHRRLCEYLD